MLLIGGWYGCNDLLFGCCECWEENVFWCGIKNLGDG